MSKYYWYLLCEILFIIMGGIFAIENHWLTLYFVFMSFWMMFLAMREAWRELKKR